VHLLGGLLAVAAGVGIVWRGHRWARTAGVVVAGLSAVVNLGFLAASPVWSTLMIALDVVVIHALTVHGWEIDNS
jgi:membrane glycosyltransferase